MGRANLAGVVALGLVTVGMVGCEPAEGRYIEDTYFTDAQLTRQADVVYGAAPPLPDQSMPPGLETLRLDVIMPSPSVDGETAQHDALAAVRWLRHNAAALEVDPTNIGASGSSAGAITALNLAYNSHDPGTSNDLTESSAIGGAVVLSGAAYGRLDPNYPPVADIGPGDAPTLDAHCTNDQAVDWNLTQAGIDAAVAQGLVAEALVWSPPDWCAPGRIHGGDLLKDHGAVIDPDFAKFLYRHLELTQVED